MCHPNTLLLTVPVFIACDNIVIENGVTLQYLFTLILNAISNGHNPLALELLSTILGFFPYKNYKVVTIM